MRVTFVESEGADIKSCGHIEVMKESTRRTSIVHIIAFICPCCCSGRK